MSQPRRNLIILFAGIFAFTLIKLGAWGVIDTSEARYSHIAAGMYHTGDYVHPVYLDIEHYHKPPFTYQITALAYHFFGVNPFAARFFLQVALIIQCLLVYLIARQLSLKRESAFHAVLIYTSFAIVWISVRNLTTDAYLNTFILASIWALIRYVRSQTAGFLYLLAVFGAMGFLTKIMAYFVVAAPAAVAILWYYKTRLRWTWHYAGSLFLFGLLVSIWFVALGDEGWAVFKYLIYEQSFVRYTSDIFFRNQPWYFYTLVLPALAFPWIFPAARWFVVRSDWRRPELLTILLIVAFIFPIVFYSLSKSKLVLYILPGFPFLALYCARYLESMSAKGMRFMRAFSLIFGILVVVALAVYPYEAKDWHGHVSLIVQAAGGILILLSLALLFPLRLATAAIPTGTMIIAVGVSGWIMSTNMKQLSTMSYVAEWLETHNLDERPVYVYDKLAPSIAFHTSTRVATIADKRHIVTRELQFEEDNTWKVYYFDLNVPDDRERLQVALEHPAVLIARHADVSWKTSLLPDHFTNVQTLGRWDIYY